MTERPNGSEWHFNENSTEFVVIVDSFESFKKSAYSYWELDQKVNSPKKRQNPFKVFIRTEENSTGDDLFTSMYFFGPRGTAVVFEEEYDSQAKTKADFAHRCVTTGLHYANKIQKDATEAQKKFTPDKPKLLVIYIDDFNVLYSEERLLETVQELEQTKPLEGTPREIEKEILTAASFKRK